MGDSKGRHCAIGASIKVDMSTARSTSVLIVVMVLLVGCPKPDRIRYRLDAIERSIACAGLAFSDPEFELSRDGRQVFLNSRIILSGAARHNGEWQLIGASFSNAISGSHSFQRAYVRRTHGGHPIKESKNGGGSYILFPIELARRENLIGLGHRLDRPAFATNWSVTVTIVCGETNQMHLVFSRNLAND